MLVSIGVVLGGRIASSVAANGYFSAASIFDLRTPGLSSFGAFLGAALLIGTNSLIRRVSFASLLDIVAVSAPIGIITVRLANYINDDFVGKPSSVPWAIMGPDGIGRHPVVFYELLFEGLIGLLLVEALIRRGSLRRPGFVAGSFIVWYSLCKLVLQDFRQGAGSSALLTGELRWILLGGAGLVLIMSSFLAKGIGKPRNVSRRIATSKWPKKISFGVAVAAITIPLTGEGGGKNADVPHHGDAHPVTVTFSNPGAEPQCKCENATGAYLNNSSDSARQVNWVVYTKDTSSGEILDPIYGTGSVPANSKDNFIGCTVHAPDTQCRFQANYELGQAPRSRSLTGKLASIYGSTRTPSLATCVSWCQDASDPNADSCLQLGVRYYKGIAPLREMAKVAQTPGAVIPKAEVLSRYGLSEKDDTCGRGDIANVDGRVINTGTTEACQIENESLPDRLLEKLGMESLAADPLKMITVLPQQVETVLAEPVAGLDASDPAIFDIGGKAPYIVFNGAGGEQLTKDFGGPVIASASISTAGLPKQTVVATGNGCIAVDEP